MIDSVQKNLRVCIHLLKMVAKGLLVAVFEGIWSDAGVFLCNILAIYAAHALSLGNLVSHILCLHTIRGLRP